MVRRNSSKFLTFFIAVGRVGPMQEACPGQTGQVAVVNLKHYILGFETWSLGVEETASELKRAEVAIAIELAQRRCSGLRRERPDDRRAEALPFEHHRQTGTV